MFQRLQTLEPVVLEKCNGSLKKVVDKSLFIKKIRMFLKIKKMVMRFIFRGDLFIIGKDNI